MIGGNAQLLLQVRTVSQNEIGEDVTSWNTVMAVKGWLDLQGGDSKYSIYSAKVQESTHVFIADYVTLDSQIKAQNCRGVIDGKTYDVMLIDDPMGMHKHLEIYLKFVG